MSQIVQLQERRSDIVPCNCSCSEEERFLAWFRVFHLRPWTHLPRAERGGSHGGSCECGRT